MAIRTVIMAGGAGVRLRPLTCGMPKPLAPLCGAPVMDYTLRLLQKHNIRSADVTLWYRPQDIVDCFGHGRHGVSLRYVTEETPVGTAGSVLLAAKGAEETVLVLSGDGLTDADLGAALAFHRKRRAAATLVLSRVEIPLPYGVVVTEADGRIRRFIEKPDWSRVVSSLVNTGIYLLEPEALRLIPPDKPFDFGRDLFPLMLEKGLALYGCETAGYWCDVGDAAAFLRAQGDLLAGRTAFEPTSRGQRALPGVALSADSFVADGARVAPGAQIVASCVLAGAEIGPGARLEGAVVDRHARVGKGALLERGAVLGASSAVGDFAALRRGVCVWPGARVPEGAVACETARAADPGVSVREGEAAAGTPAQLGWLAGAFAHTGKMRTAVVVHSGDCPGAWHTVLGALAAYGCERVVALGRGSAGMLAWAVRALGADGGLLCRGEGTLLLDPRGLPLSGSASQAVASAAQRQDLPVPKLSSGSVRAHSSLRNAYLNDLASAWRCAEGLHVALRCRDRFLRALAREAALRAGHVPDDAAPLTIAVTEDAASLLTAEGAPAPWQQWLLCARALRLRGEAVYDVRDLGLAGDGFLPPDEGEACLRQRRLFRDGVAQLLMLLSLFSAESPDAALRALPALACCEEEIPCPGGEKGRVMEALLADAAPRAQGGLEAERSGARAVVRPDPLLPLMRVAVSARDAETARELCGLFSGKVRIALEKKDDLSIPGALTTGDASPIIKP